MTQVSDFNLKVTHTDRRGRILKRTPYRLFVRQGEQLFECPKHSGNLFYENGAQAGRVEFSSEGRTFRMGAPHVAYVPPLSGAAKVEAEKLSLEQENAQLKAELSAIKAEQLKAEIEAQKKSAPPAKEPALAKAQEAAKKEINL